MFQCSKQKQVQNDDSIVVILRVVAEIQDAKIQSCHVHLVNNYEYRRENPFIAIKKLHKMTQKQAIKEMSTVGLKWVETKEFLPSQHLLIFSKV